MTRVPLHPQRILQFSFRLWAVPVKHHWLTEVSSLSPPFSHCPLKCFPLAWSSSDSLNFFPTHFKIGLKSIVPPPNCCVDPLYQFPITNINHWKQMLLKRETKSIFISSFHSLPRKVVRQALSWGRKSETETSKQVIFWIGGTERKTITKTQTSIKSTWNKHS